jgi:putative mRNA 3-end processing factor
MKFTFLGGANEIGSTALLLETDKFKCIFEYGLTPKDPPEYPLESPPLDYIFLSHAHLDHSGMIPFLTRQNSVPFFTSQMTLALSQILLRDNVKICEFEGYPILYSKSDIKTMEENLHLVADGSVCGMNNAELTVHSAGHIPGSTMFHLNFDNGPRLLFSGDINTIDTQLVTGTTGKKCDILALESTYADVDHELRQKIEYRFINKIREVVEGGGKVVIPAFAVGRTQEILLILADLDYEIWLDGLGKDVTKLFLKAPGFIRNEKKLRKIYDTVHRVRTKVHRKKALGGDIIVTTSGMLDGGPVLKYIDELNGNTKHAVLLTGYQVEGTNGRRLLNDGIMNIYGEEKKIELDVEYFDFSAHAGHKDLLTFAKKCNPEHIILYHGEHREVLEKELSDKYQVHMPNNGESFEIK